MSDLDSGTLRCPNCQKEYPEGYTNCPYDSCVLQSNQLIEDPLIGKVFAEKYDVLSLLGEGGMSRVYKARHKFMKRIVAIKLLHESATRDLTAKDRFQQEAEAASALSHQNVVTVHDFGFTPNGQAFLVMDCLEGKALDALLEEANYSLPLAELIDIFTQALDGLEHAHRKGIVHRDIKPSNLVVLKQEDGTDLVKIVDFGIAKVLVPQEGEKQRQLTQAGEIFGSPAYMSPEQCSGKALDGRSDLYSFGCMMYEAMSGQLPHIGDNFINTVVKHINEEPKSIAEVSPNARVPSHIEEVIMKCLAKKPDDRYRTAVELKQALLDAAFASGVKGLRFGAVQEPKSFGATSAQTRATISLTEMKVTQTWRLKLSVTIAFFVVILAGIAAWMFLYPGPEGDKGTPFNKMSWQACLSSADSLDQQQRYPEAVKELEKARKIAETKFEDHQNRLELTLNKLALEYGLAHDYAGQESANKQVIKIGAERVGREYEILMRMLGEWESPTNSDTKAQERALQAIAFADRIEHCADKLYNVSREREEILLRRAIKVFAQLESIDWRICEKLRISLAECYHVQQRFGKQRELLEEAVKNCPEDPVTTEGWRTKIQAKLLLAQLDRDEAVDEKRLNCARKNSEEVLTLLQEKLPSDKQLMRDTMNTIAVVYRLYHTKEFDEKALAIENKSKTLENQLDTQAAKNPEDDSTN